MGKPTQDVKKKQEFKSPVSPFWLGMFSQLFGFQALDCWKIHILTWSLFLGALGFVVFGGLIFELLSRFFM